jgi:hypothetical protein
MAKVVDHLLLLNRQRVLIELPSGVFTILASPSQDGS